IGTALEHAAVKMADVPPGAVVLRALEGPGAAAAILLAGGDAILRARRLEDAQLADAEGDAVLVGASLRLRRRTGGNQRCRQRQRGEQLRHALPDHGFDSPRGTPTPKQLSSAK